MTKNIKKRWRLFADVRIQGMMCVRLAMYWMFCQIAVVGTILAVSCLAEGTLKGSSAVEMHFIIPALAVSTLVFPLFVFDMIVFTNRFAGPMVNFRRKMKQLADNEPCEEVSFRDGDYYLDLGEHFNQIRQKVQSQPSTSADNSSLNLLPSLETSNPTGIENHV